MRLRGAPIHVQFFAESETNEVTHHHVLKPFELARIGRDERDLQDAFAGFQAALTHGEFDFTRMWIESDRKLVREMLAELLQVAGSAWRRDLRDAASGRSNGDGFGHSLLSTVLAAASSAAAIFSAAAASS